MRSKNTKPPVSCRNTNGLRKVKILYNNKFQQSEVEKLNLDSTKGVQNMRPLTIHYIVASKNTHASHLIL